MIKFRLGCSAGHQFEAWFSSGDAYEAQSRRHLVVCPECGSQQVDKVPMAPALIRGRKSGTRRPQTIEAISTPTAHPMIEAMREFKKKLLADSENVGPRFADEARKIYFGESEQRTIHGEISLDDARRLTDEGIQFGVLPRLPEDQN